jgi:general secretion pathway protein G
MVRRRRSRAARLAARGYSLLEILVVLTIIGLLTAAVGFALFQHFQKARIETTRQNAIKIRSAAQLYKMNHSGDECPTFTALVNDQILDQAGRQTDAWDHPFTIACDEKENIIVSSMGPDGRKGTDDDIVAPAPPQLTAKN